MFFLSECIFFLEYFFPRPCRDQSVYLTTLNLFSCKSWYMNPISDFKSLTGYFLFPMILHVGGQLSAKSITMIQLSAVDWMARRWSFQMQQSATKKYQKKFHWRRLKMSTMIKWVAPSQSRLGYDIMAYLWLQHDSSMLASSYVFKGVLASIAPVVRSTRATLKSLPWPWTMHTFFSNLIHLFQTVSLSTMLHFKALSPSMDVAVSKMQYRHSISTKPLTWS